MWSFQNVQVFGRLLFDNLPRNPIPSNWLSIYVSQSSMEMNIVSISYPNHSKIFIKFTLQIKFSTLRGYYPMDFNFLIRNLFFLSLTHWPHHAIELKASTTISLRWILTVAYSVHVRSNLKRLTSRSILSTYWRLGLATALFQIIDTLGLKKEFSPPIVTTCRANLSLYL